MNEYNERTLKNVLDDLREEKDKEFLKEIEEAANDPVYQNREGEAEAFAKKNSKPKKNKTKKFWFRAASILLVLVIGLSFIPINVEGRKSTVAELIVNCAYSDYIIIGIDDILLTYEGRYIPSWVPEGYEAESVSNSNAAKQIIFKNADGNMIIFSEETPDTKTSIDSNTYGEIQNIEVNGYKGITFEEDGVWYVVLAADDLILYISSNDLSIDPIGFAKNIEKR